MGAITRTEFENVKRELLERDLLPREAFMPQNIPTAVPVPSVAPHFAFSRPSSTTPRPSSSATLAEVSSLVPELPSAYLERSKSLVLLKQALLAEASAGSNHPKRKVAAHGMVSRILNESAWTSLPLLTD